MLSILSVPEGPRAVLPAELGEVGDLRNSPTTFLGFLRTLLVSRPMPFLLAGSGACLHPMFKLCFEKEGEDTLFANRKEMKNNKLLEQNKLLEKQYLEKSHRNEEEVSVNGNSSK